MSTMFDAMALQAYAYIFLLYTLRFTDSIAHMTYCRYSVYWRPIHTERVYVRRATRVSRVDVRSASTSVDAHRRT